VLSDVGDGCGAVADDGVSRWPEAGEPVVGQFDSSNSSSGSAIHFTLPLLRWRAPHSLHLPNVIAGPLPTRGRIATVWIAPPHPSQELTDGTVRQPSHPGHRQPTVIGECVNGRIRSSTPV